MFDLLDSLEAGADKGLEVGVVAALVLSVGSDDLADRGQQRLLHVARGAGQVQPEALGQLPLRRRVVLVALLELVKLDHHVPGVDHHGRIG